MPIKINLNSQNYIISRASINYGEKLYICKLKYEEV